MKRRHIAIFSEMGNGHVFPVLPLSSALVRRGYRVTFPTDDYYSRSVRNTRAEPVIYRNKPLGQELESWWKRTFTLPVSDPKWFDRPEAHWSYLARNTSSVISQLQPFYEQNPPDLVIYDRYLLPGRILAHRLGAPAIQIAAHFACYRDTLIRENGVCHNPETLVSYASRVESFLSTHGLTTAENLWHVEPLNIYLVPSTFQFNSDSFDGRFCFVGRDFSSPSRSEWIDNSNGKPIVLLSGFSGLSGRELNGDSFFRMIIEALAESEYHCILSVRDHALEELQPGLPPNFEVNRLASHLEILPHAALSICHGGMGTTLEAIYNGVPLLAIPVHPYADEVGYRVAELGLGVRLSKDTLTIRRIMDGVGEVLGNSGVVDRVREMQQQFQYSGGAELAADKIEKFFETIKQSGSVQI